MDGSWGIGRDGIGRGYALGGTIATIFFDTTK
jgi:hypothetical protein